MRSSNIISIIILFAAVILGLTATREGFTSPGTMDQLASTHVPIEEDMYYYTQVYPKQLRREITSMTGGDPGQLRMPLPPLGGYYIV
jgi:hypothetical protein